MSENRVYTVNDLVHSIEELHGRTLQIACVLHLESEGNLIWHLPASERHPNYRSSLWAHFDEGTPERSAIQPEAFRSRHAIVTATVDKYFTGHMGL